RRFPAGTRERVVFDGRQIAARAACRKGVSEQTSHEHLTHRAEISIAAGRAPILGYLGTEMRQSSGSSRIRSAAFAVTAALFVAQSLSACSSDRKRPSGVVCTKCGDCEEDIPVDPNDAIHVPDAVDYPDPPPVGGPHNPCWTTWGVHTDVVPPERWVHNLEH